MVIRLQEPEIIEESLEERLARLEIEAAQDTIDLCELAALWDTEPGETVQAVAESMRPGQTLGERVREILTYGAEE